jgi:transcriptional regulator with XRE-family HTH domain
MSMSDEARPLAQVKAELFARVPDVGRHYDELQQAKAFVADVRRELAAMRRHAKLTQRQLAQRLGVSQPVVSRLESDDEGDLGLQTLYRYARACGVRPVLTFVPDSAAVFDAAMTHVAARRRIAPAETTPAAAPETLHAAHQAFLHAIAQTLHATLDKTMRTMAGETPTEAAEQKAAPERERTATTLPLPEPMT